MEKIKNIMWVFKKCIFIQFLLILSLPAVSINSPQDSIGIRTISNSNYIIHKVDKGETLYALARRYNIGVQQIIDANPESKKGLNIGQDLKIPYKGVVKNDSKSQTDQKIIHTVKSGESLYVISQKYGVTVNNIKKWNGLKSNNISIGKRLSIYPSSEVAEMIYEDKKIRENNGKNIHIVNSGETLYSISKKYNITTDNIKEWNRLESNDLRIGQELIIGYAETGDQSIKIVSNLEVEDDSKEELVVKTEKVEEVDMVKAEEVTNYKRVTQKGVAKVIEGSETTQKYLALHRTAPIGTIMQIRNEMNDLSVFVRVIGKLPETTENTNLLVKVSQTAYDRLGAIDSQFQVEITYHP